MNLSPTDEQQMLRESAALFLRDTFTAEHRRKSKQRWQQLDHATWMKFAELGWLVMPLPEQHGGLEKSAQEIAILMEEFGRCLAESPYLSTVILGAGIVAALGNSEQQAAILPAVASGECLLAWAHTEQQSGANLADVETRATRVSGGWRLTGKKIVVLDAAFADRLIVSARVSGDARAREGIGLFLIERNSSGVTVESYPRLGGGTAATVTLRDVEVAADAHLGASTDALPVIEAQVDRASAATCAEAIGMMAALVEATTAYMKAREQFGRPLSANQVIRHRLADMATALEESRALTQYATLSVDAEPVKRIKAISAAKVKVGRGARFIAEQSVQLHGGMGVTEELEIGAYFKRLLAFEVLFGGVDHHLHRHAVASGRLPSSST